MKPVHQTRFGEGGNCVPATIASLLELRLNQVPDWKPGPGRRRAMNRWLQQFGLQYQIVPFAAGPPTGFHTMSGQSPRATPNAPRNHMVVGRDGHLAHDPHPSGLGLATVTHYGVIGPIP